jgi:hypothetical protein
MTPEQYMDTIPAERKEIFARLREIILQNDKKVTEVVQNTMGKPMLVYNCNDSVFKYALASPKGHISFHSMVMYGNPKIKEKYMPILPKGKFQKGCINFPNLKDFPFDVVEDLIRDSAGCPYPPDLSQYRKSK